MNKSKNVSGQPIISQVLDFIASSIKPRTAQEHNNDRHFKRFETYDQIVTMIL
jgi:hypothetical protein